MTATVRKKHLELRTAWCKGCGICAAFCPKSVLKIENGRVRAVNAENCIACGLCELRCPDYAIYLREDEADEL